MDFDDAIKAHAAWKLRLSLLNDGLVDPKVADPASIARDDACELGKWLHGEAAGTYEGDADFTELKRVHAQFHIATAELVRRIHGGAKLAQDEIDNSKYARFSGQVIVLLQTMRRRLAR